LIKGSERGGRIVLADVRAFVQRLLKQSGSAVKTGVAPAAPAQKPAVDFSKWGSVSRQAMSPLRQTISRRMSENWNAVPHVTQFDEADITALLELRKRYAAAYEKAGAKLTLTSFALKAVVAALQKHPIFNSSLDEAAHQIVLKQYFHIGLAVDTEHGLLVPVLRDVDRKNLLQLSREITELAEKARARKLTTEELQGGSFTISNQGGIGGAHFTPIVNRPEVAILGLGRGAARPVVVDGQVTVRTMLPIAVSYDHRVIDGGSAARFVTDLVSLLQTFPEADLKL
jgi:pyruvate dehydrogenase E2 component (dihydrolipoamide acetyltransferase)